MSVGLVFLHKIHDFIELHDADETTMRHNELSLETSADAVHHLTLELHYRGCVVAAGRELFVLDALVDTAHEVVAQIAATVDAARHARELLKFHAISHLHIRVVQ